MNLIDSLMKTGLTKNESEIYVALCREGDLTGYEAAKITGIPRANSYQALAGLVDKGGAYIIEGAVLHYTAVNVEEYCTNVINNMEHVIKRIKQDCPTFRKRSDSYITISGIDNVQNKMKNIINNASQRIYVSLSENELSFIVDELKAAIDRGVKVVVIASGNVEIQGAVIHNLKKSSGQIRIISDTKEAITGQFFGDESDTCLYSEKKPLVELIKDSIKNEIKLSSLEEERI